MSHSSERWADVQVGSVSQGSFTKKTFLQDAAIKDLEHAIAFSGESTFLEGRKGAAVHHQTHGEEEEEISPPPDVKEEGKEAEKEEGHRCARCGKSFSRLSLLNR